jgi:Rieske Fe-S protein
VAATRRDVLKVGCGAICLGISGCGQDQPVLPATMDAGNEQDLQPGTLTAVQSGPAAIGRDSLGIYALSLVCTHDGCDIRAGGTVSAGSIVCQCHGQVFDGQGNLLRGPARKPLPHLVVTADSSGNLTIHGDQTTDPSTRI